MARLSDFPEPSRSRMANLECPTFSTRPWVTGPPLARRRVALVSTAGLHVRGDRPFGLGASDYRVIPGGLPAGELVMSHVSVNFDRAGFAQDLNVVFPLDILGKLADRGVIGSVADRHYSFMGATPPEKMAPTARELAGLLKADQVDAVFLVPV